MECPPPNTKETVGVVIDLDCISAIASPPQCLPTVLRTISKPLILGFCSAATSCGMTCSYLVVLFLRQHHVPFYLPCGQAVIGWNHLPPLPFARTV